MLVVFGVRERQEQHFLAVLRRRQLKAQFVTFQFDLIDRTLDQLKHCRVFLLRLICTRHTKMLQLRQKRRQNGDHGINIVSPALPCSDRAMQLKSNEQLV